MVGVGGRSGGCHTCRRRRVKCDENHPSCERCAKAKIACEGYARDLKFVDEKGRAQKRVQIKRQAYLEAVHAEEEQAKAHRLAKKVIPKNSTPEVGRMLSLAGCRDRVELTFMLNKLFEGMRLFVPFVMQGFTGEEECTTTQTVKALSSVYFGRVHHDQKSVDMGRTAYSKALSLLSVDLKDAKVAGGLPCLTNVLALAIFEMMAAYGGGMIQHLGGVRRLLEARGPKKHRTEPELGVLMSARPGVIHQYMEQKKSCFLSTQEWRTIPWVDFPELKTLLQLLYDEKAHLPGLLENMEALRTGQRASPSDVRQLCVNVNTRLQALYTWRAAWEAANPNCCYAVQVSDPNIPFTTLLYYTSFDRVVEIGQYNSCLLLLYRMSRILMGPGFSSTAPAASIRIKRTNKELLLPGDTKTPQDVAHEFLRSVQYQKMEPHRNGGYFQMIAPLRSMFEVFKPESPEYNYCQNLFSELASNGGFELCRRFIPFGVLGRMLMDEDVNT